MDPSTMEEAAPDFLLSPSLFISNLLSNYGWYILLMTSALFYIWTTILKPKYSSIVKKNSLQQQSEASHSDAIQDARKILQERYDSQAKLYAEKVKQKKQEKFEQRKEMLKNLEGSDGHRLGSPSTVNNSVCKPKSSQTNTPKLRPEYFPMMGVGGSGSHRSSRSSGASGGG